MGERKKTVLLAVLGLLEVVLLSWIFAANVPRRSADLETFTRYQNAPTAGNREVWLRERRITQREVTRRRYIGSIFAVGNLVLIGWAAQKGTGGQAGL